jgi:alkanesulfonate monooxygenase SsuD/methylene tetrahydromethanopterin reductase-like flavin-dependent oxidoreductase (luciferase family)
MRYGLLVANVGSYSDPRHVARVAEAAEGAGWEAFLLWDHLGFVWGPPASDPWVSLAAAAAATTRIQLGTGVTPVPRRRPHVLAHAVATLDLLSGGRVVFGAGLGGVPAEFDAFGEDSSSAVRWEQLEEGLDVLRRLWSGERVDHRGSRYTVDGVTLAPPPLRRPPIWIGGNSSRARSLAVHYDGWFADSSRADSMSLSPDTLAKLIPTGAPAGFDVVVHGRCDCADPRAYAAAGATWWLEDLHDLRGSADELLALVEQGPPGRTD